MTKREAKRRLLADIALILVKDDDLFPSDVHDGSADYRAYDAAREELAAEFERRAGEK